MRFAYADPPYLGCAAKLYADHPDHAVYDTVEGHKNLIDRLAAEFPDGWALSMTSGNLHDLLPLCPRAARVMAWVKTFASWKMNVRVAYAWEPVIVYGGRKRSEARGTVRDWCAVPVTLKAGFNGAKPRPFSCWLFEVLGMEPSDEFIDLFPGSGAVGEAWASWRLQMRLFG